MNKEQALEEAKTLLECDSVRISQPIKEGRMFLIMGHKRNTKDDAGFWSESSDGQDRLKNWDYLNEQVVAKGYTLKELIEDVRFYVALSKMTFSDLVNDKETFNKFLGSLT